MLPTFHLVVELFLLASLFIAFLKCLKYKNLSEKDLFTSAYHKQWLNVNLVNLMRKAKSEKKTLGLAFADLDKFKKINDTWGHDYGDRVLLAVVKAINSVIGKAGKLVRYGGDEFVLLLPNVTEKSFSEILSQVRKAISDTGMITASIGGTVFRPHEELNFSKLLKRADRAVYQAKNKGRNRIVIVGKNFHKNNFARIAAA
jgi:diguanylate cyclase (GGDEF)-like protein